MPAGSVILARQGTLLQYSVKIRTAEVSLIRAGVGESALAEQGWISGMKLGFLESRGCFSLPIGERWWFGNKLRLG